MSNNDSPRASTFSSSTLLLPLGLRSRRGSFASLSASSQIDKDQLSQALDQIHSSASHSETLTTFNEFAAPPSANSNTETKGLAGDLIQNGFSGLYNRFRGAVGAGNKDRTPGTPGKDNGDVQDGGSIKSQRADTPTSMSRLSISGLSRLNDSTAPSPNLVSASSSRLHSPIVGNFSLPSGDGSLKGPKSSKSSGNSLNRPPVAPLTKNTVSSAVVPTIDLVHVTAVQTKDKQPSEKSSQGMRRTTSDASAKLVPFSSNGESMEDMKPERRLPSSQSNISQASVSTARTAVSGRRDRMSLDRHEPLQNQSWDQNNDQHDLRMIDGSGEPRSRLNSTSKGQPSAMLALQSTEASQGMSESGRTEQGKRTMALDKLTHSNLPGYRTSQASSTNHSAAEASPVHSSAHDTVRHGSFSQDDSSLRTEWGRTHIPGTTTNEGAPAIVSARLEQMRKQVLSKEFWMADDACKECFKCNDPFSAFRRKHHCRTCGCIFDSKCTSTISGQRFGVQGNLRVCKTCLDVINRRHDSSGSDDSADDAVLPTSFFQAHSTKFDNVSPGQSRFEDDQITPPLQDGGMASSLSTPMMAIPATRRIGESSNRRSAVLEIDAPQLMRPNSSRSLKAVQMARPPSSGHRRHQSKHNFLGRFKSTPEERAPFHGDVADDAGRRSRLPAFHDDNIIDPDLAPYMSDDGSSGDEQMSIFSVMTSSGVPSSSHENERSGFSSLLTSGKKHRSRNDKSLSGISFNGRMLDDASHIASPIGYPRANRRRNLSAVGNALYGRPSPKPAKPSLLTKGIDAGEDGTAALDTPSSSSTPVQSRMTRSASMRDAKAPAVELNSASLHHVKRLLRQLLQDADIPNISSWEKALVPILLRCTDDVNPDVRHGDDIDIRHYVKLKKVPGGRPGDTSYVSGVVFTKNLALKSMPRSISHPRIVVVSFPIEYQRHQHHFMSLEPVIAQEKQFLKNMVNRIASLRPQLLLIQKHISGLALQYLAEANIAVAYNVKQSVIEAVSRCAQTEVISSIDMVALKPVHVGKSAGFDVKTYVHKDIPGKKKTCFYLSGCPKELGCTIVLRGASMNVLTKMKRITEFMVYVVYNLKLETCLMRDEFVLIPSSAEISGSISPSRAQASQAIACGDIDPKPVTSSIADAADKLHAVNKAANKFKEAQQVANNSREGSEQDHEQSQNLELQSSQSLEPSNHEGENAYPSEAVKLVSAHASHTHASPDSHDETLPDDVPMPTFYSDMVAKHQTKILSASPFVKFMQPYLLMRAREQERRLVYLRRLRDQDTFEEQGETEKSKPQKFQLIKPEMVHETVKGAPKQIMEVLHAVHDAEYDKALHIYQTQKRQWENYIQGNANLFDPYAHQNIIVLYTVVCTATTVPCTGPEVLALAFYNEHEISRDFDADCTLGQYVEDLCLASDTICTANGCERKMSEHHRTYVHGEARITVFVEKSLCKIKGLHDSILMWSYCKICKKETQVMPMSESTWKYSFGKYLELSFWSSELRLRAGVCPHDLHRDHLRYFGYKNVAMRIHYDPIDLLEIIVPRARITWKVDNDLKLKNDLFTKSEERWNKFMASVKSRIKGINIDSVEPEKAEACKAEVEKLNKRAQDEHISMIRKLQEKYMESKYYEIIPLNRAIRAMQEKVAEWDASFADFDGNFFPSEKDIRRLAALQLKKMFMDRDYSTTSVNAGDAGDTASDADEKSADASIELAPTISNVSADDANSILTSVVDENVGKCPKPAEVQEENKATPENEKDTRPAEAKSPSMDLEREDIQHLDLAISPREKTEFQHRNSIQSSMEVSRSASPAEQTPDPTKSAEYFDNPSLGSDATLSQKVERIRKSSQPISPMVPEPSGIPRPSDRATSRKSGTSPPMSRTQSQPAGTLRRLLPTSTKTYTSNKEESGPSRKRSDANMEIPENWLSSNSEGRNTADRKLSERLGLALKTHRKSGQSLIPRSVQGSKKKETNVSALAKHFEQLSREFEKEFEKERLRDRKQRAQQITQSQAFPKASSKPIVAVYKDVNEAVEEQGPADDDITTIPSTTDQKPKKFVEGLADLNTGNAESSTTSPPRSPTGTMTTAAETVDGDETDNHSHSHEMHASEDETAGSDVDPENSLLDGIPGVADLAESLGVSEPSTDVQLELPKHEKTSLMKMLTNFWAERSASGWTALEYPLSASDHVFVDSDVIVREDEPSSLIAFALSSEDYLSKLANIREQGHSASQSEPDSPVKMENMETLDHCEDGIDQVAVKTSLLRATGTHLKYQFAEGSAKMLCKIFYAEQFDAVRRKCGVGDRIVESLSRCLKWDSKGGKTKSVFLKTLDDRLVLKSLSPIETQAFLKFAPAYFNLMAEVLFHELPSVIAKMLGFYQIVIKNPVTGTEIKWDVLVMENLFYDRVPARIFDLKGSMRNRKIESTGEQNEVLLDENMVEFIYESPLFAREHSKKLLRASVWNDTLFLKSNQIMDYSLMAAVDEARKELVVGIIDCLRVYSFDKKLESWLKAGKNRPTVVSPKEYRARFRLSMESYFLCSYDCWSRSANNSGGN